jgi:hypothetical protein
VFADPFPGAADTSSLTMVLVATGKRAGARRGARAPRQLNPAALAIGAGITLCVVAWGYLVYAAIDFGTAARDGSGKSSSWGLMALACLGAVGCLFVGLMLIARLMRVLGVTSPAAVGGSSPSGGSGGSRGSGSAGSGSAGSGGAGGSGSPAPPAGPRSPGGKRAAR